jgi:spermidine synthase
MRQETAYTHFMKLQVSETRQKKMFKLDGATHSVIGKRSVYANGYWDYFIPMAYAYTQPRVLMIGLGLGTTSYQLHRLLGRKTKVDAVEIDGKVADLARRNAPEAMPDRLIIADGCDYVAETRSGYDMIVLDAYWRNASVPGGFFSGSFVGNAKRILHAKGVLAVNYTMSPQGLLHWLGFGRRLKRNFNVYKVQTDHADTVVLLCSKGMDKEEMLERIAPKVPADRRMKSLMASYRRMKEL